MQFRQRKGNSTYIRSEPHQDYVNVSSVLWLDTSNKLNRWIRAQRKKSGEWFKVPLLPKALAIIEKYQDNPLAQANGKVLLVYTNQKTNSYLKEIAASQWLISAK
ncbi:hypothetical protein [Tunicatimonas pelagia]|uniref:hypothetical protein n=1 Tax=Tunicatimonas pelagia TaxID=931531 RepID=UPI00345C9534